MKKRKKTARDSEKFNPSDFGKKVSVEELKEELIDGMEEDDNELKPREDDSYPILNISYDTSNENGNEFPQTCNNIYPAYNSSDNNDNGLDNQIIKEVNGKPITIRKKQIKQGHSLLVDYQGESNDENIQTTYGSKGKMKITLEKDIIQVNSNESFKVKKGILNKERSKKERSSIRDDLYLNVGDNKKLLDRINKRDTIYRKGYTSDVFKILENDSDKSD